MNLSINDIIENMRTNKKGFTLIELLVVIAIIGILAAVVIPALNTARSKAQVAAFQSEMDNMRKAAEVYYSGPISYAGMFTNGSGADIATSTITDTSIQNLLSSLANRASDGTIYGSANANAYAVYGRIPGTDPASLLAADIWCIDNVSKSDHPSADATSEFTTAVSVCW